MNQSHGRPVAILIALVVICMLFLNYSALQSFVQTHSSSISSPFALDSSNEQPITGKSTTSTAFSTNDADSSSSSTSYQLASDQSYGFFHDVPSHYWREYQHIVSEYVRHRNPDDPLEYVPGLAKNTKWAGWNSEQAFYGTNYEPNFSCPFERRVGFNGNGDGPKWVCDPKRLKRLSSIRKQENSEAKNGCLIYSVGSAGNFQFEEGLQEILGKDDACEIHTFDFGDFQGKKPDDQNMHYHQWGLKSSTDKSKSRQYRSLEEIVEELGHQDRTIDIFKIDCEKCEWDTVKDWFGPKIPLMQQILVEVHGTPIVPKDKTLTFFNGILEAGYVMFHKEPNIQWAGGQCVEFAFLKLHDDFFADVEKMKGRSIDSLNQ